MKCLWYVTFWHLCFKQEHQQIEWITKGQVMVLSICVLQYKGFVFRQHSPFLWEMLVFLMAGCPESRLADKMQVDFKIFKFLYRLNYLDLHFVINDINAMLSMVLEVHFSPLLSNTAYFRVCFEVCKIQLPFFFMSKLLIPTIR